jgi:hypothetical protein
VHAQQRQYALASLNPRVKMDCPVFEPPAIELSDPFFGLAAGAAYTLEFAMYPFDSACADWFCFVNALRHGYETDTIVVGEHSGSLNTLENNPGWDIDGGAHAGNGMNWNGTGYTDPRCGPWGPKAWPFCTPQNATDGAWPGQGGTMYWGANWTAWSAEQLQHFVKQHGTTVIPVSNGWVPGVEKCRACRMEDNGASFVFDNSSAFMEYIPRVFEAAKRASTPTRRVDTTYYFHAFCSTRVNDSLTYADSRILDKDGKQMVYLQCNRSAPGWTPVPEELPLFYGTLTNSYGPVLQQYVQKIFDLGFTGVYHGMFHY